MSAERDTVILHFGYLQGCVSKCNDEDLEQLIEMVRGLGGKDHLYAEPSHFAALELYLQAEQHRRAERKAAVRKHDGDGTKG